MWFNNALIYKYDLDSSIDLNSELINDSLKPCPPHARFIHGWVNSINDELVYESSGCSLICMGKEERILPRAVINRVLQERVEEFEEKNGHKLKRSDKKSMAEDLEFELLPKAFCIEKRILALFDPITKYLIINSSSNTQAAEVLKLLKKSIPSITIEPIHFEENLALKFANWISHPSLLPKSLQLGADCLLFLPNDERKRFNCKGYELPADEVLNLLSQGLAVSEISIIWNERIQLTITKDFTLKRLKCLDYLVDEFNDLKKNDEDEVAQQDSALILLSGELRSLINDLIKVLKVQDKTEIQVAEELIV